MTRDRIEMAGMTFTSHVGHYAEEKRVGQALIIDLVLLFDRPLKAAETDGLTDTVNYDNVFATVKALVENADEILIERLAQRIADAVLTAFPAVDEADVTVRKPKAPLAGTFDYMAARLCRRRLTDRRPRFKATVAVGGNLGDRAWYLSEAVRRLDKTSGIWVVARSSLYETAPWGVEDQGPFLNAVVRVETTHEPFSLLNALNRIELSLGRVRDVRYGPRTIDLDLLTFDGYEVNLPELTIPHPRMQERAFVMVPYEELEGRVLEDETVTLYTDGWC